jgi:hypothetical protein
MSTCPACQHPGAYVGFSTVECVNFDCRRFNVEQYNRWQAEEAAKVAAVETPAPDSGVVVLQCGSLTVKPKYNRRRWNDVMGDGYTYEYLEDHAGKPMVFYDGTIYTTPHNVPDRLRDTILKEWAGAQLPPTHGKWEPLADTDFRPKELA